MSGVPNLDEPYMNAPGSVCTTGVHEAGFVLPMQRGSPGESMWKC